VKDFLCSAALARDFKLVSFVEATMGNLTHNQKRLMLLVVSVVLVALLHFIIPTEPHFYHKLHIVLRKLYILPPVMAAAWFGLRGACLTAAGISFLFLLHAFLDWPGNYMEQANQVGELVGFWVATIIPGLLFDRQRAQLREIAAAHEETLFGLVSALDLREHNTRLHSQRVREYTELLAERVGVDEKARREIGLGALLHDVGKIAVPDQILLKGGKLTGDEWREMRKHPEAGYQILASIGFLKNSAELVRSHHERYDGTGYPRGLKEEEIPLGARLFMIADVFDALTSTRPYRSCVTPEAATIEILAGKGSHFDPSIVDIFTAIPPAELQTIALRYQENES
jgi:putative nucleotidyltransferase with HDIG domain